MARTSSTKSHFLILISPVAKGVPLGNCPIIRPHYTSNSCQVRRDLGLSEPGCLGAHADRKRRHRAQRLGGGERRPAFLYRENRPLGRQQPSPEARPGKGKERGLALPAFWGPNYDWVPDQDHGGGLLKTIP